MSANYKTDVLGSNAPIKKSLIETIEASVALNATDGGTKFLVATDALVITLPATKKGVEFTIINSGADGNNVVTISPQAGDAIIGSIANSDADSVSGGADGKDIINTKSTANKGDRITLIGDGDAGWYIVDGVGIWASQA